MLNFVELDPLGGSKIAVGALRGAMRIRALAQGPFPAWGTDLPWVEGFPGLGAARLRGADCDGFSSDV